MKNVLIIVVLFLALLVSCDVSESESNPNNTILPLQIGNEWNYHLTQYKNSPVDSSVIIIDSSSVHMKITKADTLDSFAGYSIDNCIVSLGWNVSSVVFCSKNDDLYIARRYGFVVPPLPPKISKVLSYPTFIGELTNYDSYSIQTTSMNEMVKISSKNYKCIVYKVFLNNLLVGKLWISPNLGIIKYWQLFGSVNLEYELINYNIK